MLSEGARLWYIRRVPAKKKLDDRQFKVGDKVRVNLHHGKIEDAVVKAVIKAAICAAAAWLTGSRSAISHLQG